MPLVPENVTILHVEDDDLEIISLKRAMKANGMKNTVVVANDGIEALECLRGENGREPLSAPYVILLDLNMPRMDGIEFLGELRRDPQLQSALVIVLTTSSAEHDRQRVGEHDVAGYIVKGELDDSPGKLFEMVERYYRAVGLPA